MSGRERPVVGPRYADCPTVEDEVTVHATADAVWALVTDIGLPARFSDEFQGARWLDGATGPGQGARFVGSNTHPLAGSWQTTCTIAEFEPGRCLAYVVNDPENPTATWRFTLIREKGQIRLRMWARIGPGPSELTRVIEANPAKEPSIVAHRLTELRGNITATLAGIKHLAEQERRG
ncbi:MAG TPA: SRPBCC family protein [Amycolatopsis sp.]|nr:SRPBCC family protein [Amycolatopsis sp.]